jgi:ATP-dependent Clp protease ATP-binding subunit ClpA
MARVIQSKIKLPLSEQILFGVLESGGSVEVSLVEKDREKSLEFKSTPAPKPEKKKDKKSKSDKSGGELVEASEESDSDS